jgi:hypothetical protein
MVVVRFEKRLVLSAFWQAIPSHDQDRKAEIHAETVWTANWTGFFHYEESPYPLAVGDHPQITKASVMAYPRFKEFPTNILGSQLANGDLLLRLEDMKPHVLLCIIEGAQTSPDLTDEVKRRYGLIR